MTPPLCRTNFPFLRNKMPRNQNVFSCVSCNINRLCRIRQPHGLTGISTRSNCPVVGAGRGSHADSAQNLSHFRCKEVVFGRNAMHCIVTDLQRCLCRWNHRRRSLSGPHSVRPPEWIPERFVPLVHMRQNFRPAYCRDSAPAAEPYLQSDDPARGSAVRRHKEACQRNPRHNTLFRR